jgi:integrase
MSKTRNPNGVGSYSKRKDGRSRWRLEKNGRKWDLSAKTPSELQAKINQVSDAPASDNKYTAGKWFDKWLENYIKSLKKAATYNQYESIYRIHIKDRIGSYRIAEIKSIDIQNVITHMHKNNMSTKTMKHAKTIMNSAFARAVKNKVVNENPVKDIEIPSKQAKPRKVLSYEELSKLFKAMKNSRWIWAVKFMLVTGMRRGEILALKWSDIDYGNKRITVDESNSTTGLGDTKTRIHYIPLSDKAISYLSSQTEQIKKECNPNILNKDGTFKDNLKGSDCLVFPTQKGEMISPNTFYHTMCRYAGKAEIKATPHCLRHTFVYLSRNTLSLKELQNILGHDESTTTLDIYGDILDESTSKTASQIDEIFNQVEKEFKKLEEKSKPASHLRRVK